MQILRIPWRPSTSVYGSLWLPRDFVSPIETVSGCLTVMGWRRTCLLLCAELANQRHVGRHLQAAAPVSLTDLVLTVAYLAARWISVSLEFCQWNFTEIIVLFWELVHRNCDRNLQLIILLSDVYKHTFKGLTHIISCFGLCTSPSV